LLAGFPQRLILQLQLKLMGSQPVNHLQGLRRARQRLDVTRVFGFGVRAPFDLSGRWTLIEVHSANSFPWRIHQGARRKVPIRLKNLSALI